MKEVIQMTFGEKLQKLRKGRGLSQEQLAAQLSVSRQALSKWELGAATPDTENVLELSKLFGVSTDYLLRDDFVTDDVRAENKLYRIVGAGLSGISLLGMLILGILSSVYPATWSIAAAGLDWGREYSGLAGFLKCYHLEWLFILCLIALVVGVAVFCYPKLRRHKR